MRMGSTGMLREGGEAGVAGLCAKMLALSWGYPSIHESGGVARGW